DAAESAVGVEVEVVHLTAQRLARVLQARTIRQRVLGAGRAQLVDHLRARRAGLQPLGHARASRQPHEGQQAEAAQGGGEVHARRASRWAFTSFDLIRLRLSGERYSTKT